MTWDCDRIHRKLLMYFKPGMKLKRSEAVSWTPKKIVFTSLFHVSLQVSTVQIVSERVKVSTCSLLQCMISLGSVSSLTLVIFQIFSFIDGWDSNLVHTLWHPKTRYLNYSSLRRGSICKQRPHVAGNVAQGRQMSTVDTATFGDIWRH